MEYVKKSIDERALHKMEYDSRVNERQTQTTVEKVDTSKELDASLVIIESNGTESQEQDTSSRSGNDAHVDDADIRPIDNEEPMAEVQTTADDNVSATGQQHTEQPESNNEGEVDQNADQWQQSQFLKEKSNEAKVKNDIDVTETINIELEHSVAKLLAENEQLHKEKEHLKQTYKDLFDSIKRTRVQTKDQNDSLMAQLNKKSNENADVLAQIQKKGFAIAALKNELRKLTGNSVNTKFAKPSILGKPVLQPHRNQFVVRQPTAFKSERPKISKERFASQVDVSNDLSKPVTTHYLPKRRESAPAKPHYMIATSSSRYSSNDIVHNHYLEEAKKKAQEHSRNSRNFSDSKHFVCSTCQKCVFNANHDACVIKFLKEVNSRAKVPSNKTTNRNKPVEQIRVATKPNRQIPTGHRFSIKRTSTVHEKTTSPRSCLRWQPTGRILKTVCLRWVPTGKTFASSTTKVESEPPNGSNADIPNQCESEQALNVSVGLVLHQMTSDHNRSELGYQDHSNEQSSSKLVPKVVPLAVKTATSRQELELLFHHHIAMLRTTGASTPAEVKRMQNVPYASAMGSIMYAVRCTRPDVAFAQNITSRFQQYPGELHWTAVKNILKYLRNTKDMFLVYGGDIKQELRISCYTDAGYLTDADDLKSQTGYVFVLNGGDVDWKSTKQSIFTTSSAEAEYIATSDASKGAVWVRKFIYGLEVVPTIEEPIKMYCDNTKDITIANESGITKGARHYRTKVHYLRKVIELGDVKIEKVHTDDNLADPFTKALAFPKHLEHTKNIGILPASNLM
ncbi:hypothetical protein Tco_0003081 [Tanacetum coccineum]